MVVRELSERQAKNGHEVHVITSDWDKNKRIEIKEEIVRGVKIHYCHHYLKVSKFSTVWPSVYKKLLQLKPDIIHAHVTGHLHTYLAMKVAKKLRIPLIVTTHCPWESKRSLLGTLANGISYKFFPVLKHADAVIAITPWEHKFLNAEGVHHGKIHTIPNGMSAEFFKKVEPNKFKEKHNIPADHKIVLFFGRLSETKNPLQFVKIADTILRERKDTTFVMKGPDEGELDFVKEIVNNFYLRVKKNFRLLPPTRDRREIAEMYQSADLLLMPSRREGNPLILYESYANGLPVIASKVNGVPDGLKDNENGFLLSPDDLKGFIDSTNFLLDAESIRLQMRTNNLEKAKEYDWDLIAKKTAEVYNNERKNK